MGIIKSIVAGLVGALVSWWKSEQAVADAWAAKSHKKQMESMVDSLAEEKRINTAPVATNSIHMEPKTFTIDDWNAGAGELV